MKKVLLTSICMVASLTWGGNVDAQTTTTTSVTFNASDDGKTLTISGQGDLTKYSAVSDELKFTSTGVNKVGTTNNQYYNNPVGASAVYNAGTTYYAYYPKKIASLYPDYATAKSVTYSWNEDKIGNLYHFQQKDNVWGWYKVELDDEIDFTGDWQSNYATDSEGKNRILISDFKNSDYFTTTLSDVTFKKDAKPYLYVLSNGKYVKLADDAEYDANVEYYSWDAADYNKNNTYVNFGAISEDEMIKLGYLEHPTENLAQILNYKLSSNDNAYTTIKFVNVGTDALTINNDIVKALLYPATATTATSNSVLTTLDLGAATCTDFSKETFAKGGALGNVVLETLTLPLNESKETPAEVVFHLQGYKGVTLKSVIVPDGYTKIGDNTFNSATNLNDIQLPSTITEIGEKAFYSCTSINEVKLGENLKTIGKFAFAGCTNMNKLTLPKNLDKVCDGAFWDLKNLLVVELNDNLRYIGNGAFGCSGNLADASKTQTTIKIPASVQYIGAYAFSERKFQDVYFLGKVAPVCPVGDFNDGQQNRTEGTAFTGNDDKVHFGNSGFISKANEKYPLADNADGEGYANRENYRNGEFYFTILHYPSDATDEDTYTDTTRKYESRVKGDGTIDMSLKTVGQEPESLSYREATNVQKDVDPGYNDTYVDGQYVWPSHSQFVRAYATAALGLEWDGVTKYSPDLSPEAEAVLKEAGYDVTREDLANIAYRGTRKFVISNGDGKSTPEYKINMTKGQWWTLCVPFNMTKKQVLETFGEDTQLCLFTSVTRQLGINGRNYILLSFTQDVLKHSTMDADGNKMKGANGKWDYDEIRTSEAPKDNDIVLWAHESYMIKPNNGVNSDKEPTFVVKNYVPVEGNPLPTLVLAKTEQLGQADDETKEYRFIGNYLGNDNTAARAMQVTIPQYSYVYAKTSADKTYKFRFYAGKNSIWKPNKSLVQTNNRGGGAIDNQEFFGSDNSPLPNSAKQASIFGEEDFGETTGVDEVRIVAGSDVLAPIFNLEGKMVSANGNASNLAKGVYVQAGKKFIVK